MASLAQIRQQYPQYNDLSDDQLADAMHSKFYPDMPRPEFEARIGRSMDPMAGASASLGPETPQPRSALEREGRSFKIGLQGTGSGVVKAAAMPFDLAAGGINAGSGLINDVFGTQIPRVGAPSDAIIKAGSSVAQAAGYEPVREQTFSPTEKLQHNIADFGTQAMTAGGALAKSAGGAIAQYAKPSPEFGGRVADVFTRPYRDAPARTFVGDTAGGVGMGTAVDALDQVVPKESPYRPLAEVPTALAGGAAGSTVVGLVEGLGRMLRGFAMNRMTDTNVPVNQQTGVPYTKGGAERAAQAFQSNAQNPGLAAREIRANADDLANPSLPGETPVSPSQMPTSGLLSRDHGLVSTEYNRARRDPTQGPDFIERDQGVKAGAAERVNSLKDPNADQMAPRAVAQQEADTQIGAARTQADDVLNRTRTQATDVVNQAREAATRAVQQAQADVDAGIAGAQTRLRAAEQSLQEAEQAARQQGSAFAGANEQTKAQASQRLDRAVVDQGYVPARAEKNRQFDNAPGRHEQLPADDVIAAARQVQRGINDLAPGGLQMPGEFVQRLRALEPRMIEAEGPTAPGGAAPQVNVGGPGTALGEDLANLRKYLGTAHESAQRSGNFDLADNIQTLRRAINATIEDAPGYADANANYRQFADQYRPSPNDEGAKFTRQIDRDPGRGNTPPSQTAERFLSGPEKVQALQRMLGDNAAGGMNAVRDYLRADFGMSVLNPDGTLNANRSAAWARNNADVLAQFPAVRAEFDNRAATARRGEQLSTEARNNLTEAQRGLADTERQGTRSVNDVANWANKRVADTEKESGRVVSQVERAGQQRVRDVEQNVDRSATGTLLREDPRDVANRVFNSKKYGASTELDDINKLVANDPAAKAGWKAAVAETLYDRVTSTRQTGETYEISYARLAKEFKDNEAMLAGVFSPEEMNTLRQGHKMLEYFKESEKRASTGSNTADAQLVPGWVQLAFRHVYGDLKGGGIIKRFKLLAEQLPSNRASAEEIAHMAWFNPDLAAYLLEKPLRGNPTAANVPLRRLEALAAGGRASGERDDQ